MSSLKLGSGLCFDRFGFGLGFGFGFGFGFGLGLGLANAKPNLCFDRPRRLSSLAGGGGDFIRAALFDNDRIERATQPELLRRGGLRLG